MFSKRKWGWYLVLWQWPLFSKGPRYKLKLLYFKKGGAISMQRHAHRYEKWRLLFGGGNLELPDSGFNLPMVNWFTAPYSSAHYGIFAGIWHRFTAFKLTLVLETQRGICREDDIERV